LRRDLRRGADGASRPWRPAYSAGPPAHGDPDAEFPRRVMGPRAVRGTNGHAARRHHDVPPGVLQRGRPNAGPRPGARAAAAIGDGAPEDVAPSGTGVSRAAVHATPMPPLRVRDE